MALCYKTVRPATHKRLPERMSSLRYDSTTLLKLAVVGLVFARAWVADGAESGVAEHVNYARPFEPPTHPALITLPPGAVEPAGWLRDWCLAARDGYTGHMDDYAEDFKHAWAADYKMTGDRLLWYNGAWAYEGGGYWFDGLGRLAYALHDDALVQLAKRRFYAVADHTTPQRPALPLVARQEQARRPQSRRGRPRWLAALGVRTLGDAPWSVTTRAPTTPQILKALETVYSSDPDCLRGITGNISNVWPAFDTYAWTGNKAVADALNAMFDKDRSRLKPTLNRYPHGAEPDARDNLRKSTCRRIHREYDALGGGVLVDGRRRLPPGGRWLA